MQKKMLPQASFSCFIKQKAGANAPKLSLIEPYKRSVIFLKHITSKKKVKKGIRVVLVILAVIWLTLYLLSSVVYKHEDLYNHSGNNFTNFGYSRYNSQDIEDAWNFFKETNGHKVYVEKIQCCYINEGIAYLANTNKEYVVLDIASGDSLMYNGSENITDEDHLRIFHFISRMHELRGILIGKYKARTLI